MRAVLAAQLRAVQGANAAEATRHRTVSRLHRHRRAEADVKTGRSSEHDAWAEQQERVRVTMWVDNIEERLQQAENKLAVLVTGLESAAQLRQELGALSGSRQIAQKSPVTHKAPQQRPISSRSQARPLAGHRTPSAPSLRRLHAVQGDTPSKLQYVQGEPDTEAVHWGDAGGEHGETQLRLLDEMALTRAALMRAQEGQTSRGILDEAPPMPQGADELFDTVPHAEFAKSSVRFSSKSKGLDVAGRGRLLLDKVLPWVPPIDFLRAVPALTVKGWPFSWYTEQLGAIIISPGGLTINGAINKSGSHEIDSSCIGRPGATPPGGLVCLHPGTYHESVRITRSCFLCGLGAPGEVVIEGKGIGESPLAFVSGEDACVSNVMVKCKSQAFRAKCVYIPSGRPLLESCTIEGGVHACGSAPRLRRCTVSSSPGCGVHLSDGCRGEVSACTITRNKSHGVLADRGARVTIIGNHIKANKGCGIRLFLGEPGSSSKLPVPDKPPDAVRDNIMVENVGGDDVCLSGALAEGMEEEEEMHQVFDLFG